MSWQVGAREQEKRLSVRTSHRLGQNSVFDSMEGLNTRRIVLLGKTGSGKSSLANTIFGEAKFKINHVNDSKSHFSEAETKSVNGRSITLIDTPGLFDPGRSEEDMKPEMVRCITECAPGPHAFLIVLKVEKFTEQEKAVVTKMCEYFSEEAFKHAAVVLTQGDQLPEGMKIEEFVSESEHLSDLVKKCSGRCHVVDNKYWKNKEQDEYRSNQFQVAELLNTIDKIVMENNGGYYTNEMLQTVEREIQKEEEHIRLLSGNMRQLEIRQQAKSRVLEKHLNNKPLRWIRGLVGLVILAGSVATVSAVLTKASPFDIIPQPEDVTPLIIFTPGNIILTPVKEIQRTGEDVLNNFNYLFERAYNLWNPFE